MKIETKVALLGSQPAGLSVIGNVSDTTDLIAIETSQLSTGTIAKLANGQEYYFNASLSTGGLAPTSGGGRWLLLGSNGLAINVKTFGATGDGVTDDTAAIQTAIDSVLSLTGGSLFFPAGT